MKNTAVFLSSFLGLPAYADILEVATTSPGPAAAEGALICLCILVALGLAKSVLHK
jgi:hypothetical protein